MTKTIFRQTASEKKIVSYIKGKFILQAILLVLGIVVFLATDYLAFTYKSLTIGLSGGAVLGSIPYSGSILFLFYGKEMEFFVPAYAIIVAILNVIVPIACIGYSAFRVFKKKEDNRVSGYVLMAYGALLLVFYILLLTVKGITAQDPNGNAFAF